MYSRYNNGNDKFFIGTVLWLWNWISQGDVLITVQFISYCFPVFTVYILLTVLDVQMYFLYSMNAVALVNSRVLICVGVTIVL